MSEMGTMMQNQQPYMDVFISESDMSYWKVIMEGPAESMYSEGTFVLTVQIPPSFPQNPPVVRFATPVLHPNITKVKYSIKILLLKILMTILARTNLP